MVNFNLRPLLALVVFIIVELIMVLKKKPSIRQPCLTPVCTGNQSVADVRQFLTMQQMLPSESCCMMLMKLSGMP